MAPAAVSLIMMGDPRGAWASHTWEQQQDCPQAKPVQSAWSVLSEWLPSGMEMSGGWGLWYAAPTEACVTLSPMLALAPACRGQGASVAAQNPVGAQAQTTEALFMP